MAAVVACALIGPAYIQPVSAETTERTLSLYFAHTGEHITVTFKRNGHYLPGGLAKLNHFLRDWRAHKETRMDPRLFDLVWEVYQAVGATQPINVVSGFRSPASNALLRSRSKAVAKHSQHMLGKAMDFFIPGIPLEKLRATAMHYQVGGVGYYPGSKGHFVHLDTGHVRAWPRMTTAQLKKVFPHGRTLHLPTNGVPLSSKGRQYAQVQWNKCHQVPCTGGSYIAPPNIRLASNGPSERNVKSVPVSAPVPAGPPDFLNGATMVAEAAVPPIPATRPAPPSPVTPAPAPATGQRTMQVASLESPPAAAATPMPASATPVAPADAPQSILASGYAPVIPQEPNAQRALQMILKRQTTGATGSRSPLNTAPSGTRTARAPMPEPAPTEPTAPVIQTASLGPGSRVGDLAGLVNRSLGAFARRDRTAQSLPAPMAALKERPGHLFAPDLDHVTEIFLDSTALASAGYAQLYLPDEADLNPATELGAYGTRVAFHPAGRVGMRADRFETGTPLVLAVN